MADLVYTSTHTALETLRAQVASRLSADVDQVVLFDGNIREAIVSHVGQQLNRLTKGVVILVGMSDDLPTEVSASGAPQRQSMSVDIYVVVRAQGTTRYTTDLLRLLDVSDKVMFKAFYDHDEWSAGMASYISFVGIQARRRITLNAPLMAHMVRFTVKAR